MLKLRLLRSAVLWERRSPSEMGTRAGAPVIFNKERQKERRSFYTKCSNWIAASSWNVQKGTFCKSLSYELSVRTSVIPVIHLQQYV